MAGFGLTYEYATLLTTSKTGIRLYFSGDTEGISATLNGNALQFKTKGNYKYLEISEINARNIFDSYTITLTKDGHEPINLVYSAAQYYNAVMAMDDNDSSVSYSVPNLKAVLAAMYQYYMSAGKVLN